MSHLIQLRQRVKTIETIKKITHAMRLISMSTHTRLKGRHTPLIAYKNALHSLFKRLAQQEPTWTHPIFYPASGLPRRFLCIVISSNKGLCGTFNTQIFKALDAKRLELMHEQVYYITIGTQAIAYGNLHLPDRVLLKQPLLTLSTLESITHACMQIIMKEHFTHVLTIGTLFKSFFKQVPQETMLIPYEHYTEQESLDYVWEQPASEILPMVAEQLLKARIYHILFESLLAEQAARFLSMDMATRNAHTLLEETQLHYNKTRQLKITKELTELITGL